MKRVYALICLVAVMSSLSVSAQEESTRERYVLLNEFASGQKFYLDRDSFRPAGNGMLEYKVESLPDQNGKTTVTTNRINCTNGTFQSYLQSEERDSAGKLLKSGQHYARPISLSRNSAMQKLMRESCAEHAPDTQRKDW